MPTFADGSPAMFDWRGVPYSELAHSENQSQIGHFEADNSNMTMMYITDWGRWGEAVPDLLGYPEVRTSSGGVKFINRTIPHYYSWLYDSIRHAPFMYAKTVDVQGLAPTGKVNVTQFHGVQSGDVGTNKKAKLKVVYKTLPYDIFTDAEMVAGGNSVSGVPDESSWARWVTHKMAPSGQYFTVPVGSYYYVGLTGPTAAYSVTHGVGKLLVTCNFVCTWHEVPYNAVPSKFANPNATMATSHIERAIGTVNSTAYNGYSKGVFLLLGADLRPYRSPFGLRLFDITYTFKYFEPEKRTATTYGNHQTIYKPRLTNTAGTVINESDWYEVVTSNANPPVTNQVTQTRGVSVYDWYDHRLLFRPPA